MRQFYKPLLVSFSIAAFFSVLYISCQRDKTSPTIVNKCQSVKCYNGGVCDSSIGKCACPSGYEDSNCATVSRLKFLGNWTAFEKGSVTLATQYPLSIQQDTAITGVVIANFNNYFTTPVRASINGDTIIIPSQELQGKVIFGIGYIYSNATYGQFGSISMRYEVIDTATHVVDDYGYIPSDLSSPSVWNK